MQMHDNEQAFQLLQEQILTDEIQELNRKVFLK